MTEIRILVEGDTELYFVDKILREYFKLRKIYITPVSIYKAGKGDKKLHIGGHGNRYQNIRKNIYNMLGNNKKIFVTTMLDYYGLPKDFPGYNELKGENCFEKVVFLENRFKDNINNNRFIPNLILHEFEGLLFSDLEKIQQGIGGEDKLDELIKVSKAFSTPEEINDSPDTAPSKRIKKIFRFYRKTYHGPLIAQKIGLQAIREKCRHFHEWLVKIEKLP